MTTSSDIIVPPHDLAGTLSLPKSPLGLIVFAHGNGLKPPQSKQI